MVISFTCHIICYQRETCRNRPNSVPREWDSTVFGLGGFYLITDD